MATDFGAEPADAAGKTYEVAAIRTHMFDWLRDATIGTWSMAAAAPAPRPSIAPAA